MVPEAKNRFAGSFRTRTAPATTPRDQVLKRLVLPVGKLAVVGGEWRRVAATTIKGPSARMITTRLIARGLRTMIALLRFPLPPIDDLILLQPIVERRMATES